MKPAGWEYHDGEPLAANRFALAVRAGANLGFFLRVLCQPRPLSSRVSPPQTRLFLTGQPGRVGPRNPCSQAEGQPAKPAATDQPKQCEFSIGGRVLPPAGRHHPVGRPARSGPMGETYCDGPCARGGITLRFFGGVGRACLSRQPTRRHTARFPDARAAAKLRGFFRCPRVGSAGSSIVSRGLHGPFTRISGGFSKIGWPSAGR